MSEKSYLWIFLFCKNHNPIEGKMMLKIKRMLKNTKKPLFYSTNYKKKYYFILNLFKNGRLLILSNTVKFFIDCLLFFREEIEYSKEIAKKLIIRRRN